MQHRAVGGGRVRPVGDDRFGTGPRPADLRASEDPQDQALIAAAEAFTAALGISLESLRWAWPLAVRAAHDRADTATTTELLAMLDGYRPGQLALMQRAERDLARARLTAGAGPAAVAAFTAAITRLRQHSTPTSRTAAAGWSGTPPWH